MLTYRKADLVESRAFNLAVIGLLLLACFSVVLVWPVSSFMHRGVRVLPGQMTVTLLQVLTIALVAVSIWQLQGIASNTYAFLHTGMKEIPSFLWLPLALSVLVIMQVFYFYRVWADSFWWLTRRIHYTVVLIVDCLFVWWLWYWNLIPEDVLQYVK